MVTTTKTPPPSAARSAGATSPRVTKKTLPEFGPKDQLYTVPDAVVPGLELRVSKDGTKSFSLRYRLPGDRRVRRIRCGSVGEVTLDEARKLAQRYKAMAAQGEDPAAPQRQRREAPDVRELGAAFLDDCAIRLKPTTVRGYRQMWRAHIERAMGTKKVPEVTQADVAALHRKMHATPYAANRVLALLSSFFNYAEREGLRGRHTNPAEGIKPYKEAEREAFLTDEQIRALWDAIAAAEEGGLRGARPRKSAPGRTAKHSPKQTTGRSVAHGYTVPAYPVATDAIRLVCLTGWRESEVLTLEWTAVDVGRKCAFLSDTKTDKSVRPLSDSALAVIERQRARSAGKSKYVFPSSRDVSMPLSDISRLWNNIRNHAGLSHVRMHDLRHTVASLLANEGASLHEIAAVLGHKDTATTRRYAHLRDQTMIERANQVASRITTVLRQNPA